MVDVSANFDKLQSIRSPLTIAAKLRTGYGVNHPPARSPTHSESPLCKGNPKPEQEQLRYPSGIMSFLAVCHYQH